VTLRAAFFFLLLTAATLGAGSDDPLLDARLNMVTLRLRYSEKHPKFLEARALIDMLSKRPTSITPEQHLAHVRERLAREEDADAELGLRYAERHPKRVAEAEKIAFLRQELAEAERTAKNSPPVPSAGSIIVNVLGSVSKPCRVSLPEGGAILDALAAAGGATKTGDLKKATLLHKSAKAEKIDIGKIMAGETGDVILHEGDTLVISEVSY